MSFVPYWIVTDLSQLELAKNNKSRPRHKYFCSYLRPALNSSKILNEVLYEKPNPLKQHKSFIQKSNQTPINVGPDLQSESVSNKYKSEKVKSNSPRSRLKYYSNSVKNNSVIYKQFRIPENPKVALKMQSNLVDQEMQCDAHYVKLGSPKIPSRTIILPSINKS